MSYVSVGQFCQQAAAVIDRASSGEHLIITRDGEPVAELRPVRRSPLERATLLRRFRALPPLDAAQLRADVDRTIDQTA